MLLNLLIKFINIIILALGTLGETIVNILPKSPFESIQLLEVPFLSALNWILPFSVYMSILSYWILGVLAYLAIQIPLRWIKAIE